MIVNMPACLVPLLISVFHGRGPSLLTAAQGLPNVSPRPAYNRLYRYRRNNITLHKYNEQTRLTAALSCSIVLTRAVHIDDKLHD